MLFGKYQYNENEIKKRGYSQHCLAHTEDGKPYWVKWILGIENNGTIPKILRDKLRSLQGAKHECLPDIIEYDFDTEQNAYAIVYEYLDRAESLENKVQSLNINDIIKGLIDLAGCINYLLVNHKIFHGDIHPGNILIDNENQFYIIDFQLYEITRTLSQEIKEIIFAKEFAAPERTNLLTARGFPSQSDIYSFGKVVNWIFIERQEDIPEDQSRNLQRLLAETPADRPRWNEVVEFLNGFPVMSETKDVFIEYKNIIDGNYLNNTGTPIFNVNPNKPDNPRYSYFVDIIINNIVFECAWIENNKKLLVNHADKNNKYIEQKIRDGEKLPFKIIFQNYCEGFDLEPYLKNWFNKKQRQKSLRQQGKNIGNELKFYKELLNKEIEIIEKNSLRLKFSKCIKNDDNDFVFFIEKHEKNSELGFILNHIEEGNIVNADGIEYILLANAERKQIKDAFHFAGKPYDLEETRDKNNKTYYKFKIKDCEYKQKDWDKKPFSGYIFENTDQKSEEKRRQLAAIVNAEKNNVQNTDLLFYLFAPDKLPPTELPCYDPLEVVYQKDAAGKDFTYSDNQNKAIRNAIIKNPLSVIQGPPGTGKTTVITEIVFQILEKEPYAKILITSQTNNAVDQVMENLLKNNIAILRLNAVTASNIKDEIREHTLGKKLEYWKNEVKKTAEKNLVNILGNYSNAQDEIKTQIKDLYKDWRNVVSSLNEESEINKKLISSIRVIGATCNHIAARKYSKMDLKFEYVIMDEAGKATTSESLVPINMGNKLVFVGDHRQLRPMLTSTKAAEKWLREKYKEEANILEGWDDYFNRPSLFEQVIKQIDPNYKTQLTECRRLPKEQVKLTSKYFYEKEGDEPIEPVERDVSFEHNLPLAVNSSVFFIDIGSNDKNEMDNTSSKNRKTADTVCCILEHIKKYPEIKNYSIGIIACYAAQYKLLRKKTDKFRGRPEFASIFKWKNRENKFMVSVVDRFQGLECDIIILDLVKSGVNLNLGFMEVPNRINVALSRNKKALFVVGDYYGTINAKTRNLKGEKAALQRYLENLKPEWIVPADKLQGLFR